MIGHIARFALFCSLIQFQLHAQDAPDPLLDQGWPRIHAKGNRQVAVHQPQVNSWTDYREIRFRSAVAVIDGRGAEPAYGVAEVSASTKVDHESRSVLIEKPEFSLRFPNVSEANAARLEAIVREVVPVKSSLVVSLDRLVAYIDAGTASQKEVAANIDPPRILFSDRPAVLVMFMGEPEFKSVGGTSLMAAVNTNWDVFLDSQSSTYYLLVDGGWISSTDPLAGTWSPAKAPSDIGKLSDDENWISVKEAVPGRTLESLPRVIASTEPAELIVTDGEPSFSPIPGTKLMQVTNTDATMFYFGQESHFYFLVAGRWFRAADLNGPWSPATFDLPAEFTKIPPDHEKGFVLASVAGTEQAEDAVLIASVPQTATVKLEGTTVSPTYDGEPKFNPIEGAPGVSYAANSPYQVFLVSPKYYCVYNGVWFVSDAANGPWVVTGTVPQVIYTIPVSSPMHNVTYVTVNQTSPTTVQTSYTSGYTGELVVRGLLLFGAGMALGAALEDDDDDWHYHYHGGWYSYGCGAVYNPWYGGYYRAAHYYGPYGGAGRAGYYNPVTGGWARGAYRYGPYGGVGAMAGYNPYTDTYRAHGGGSSIYGSWGRTYVERDDEWIRAGHNSNAWGTTGWIEGSEGNAAMARAGERGSGVVVKHDDDIYVGKDGNVYKRDDDGEWTRRESDDWEPVEQETASAARSGASRPEVQTSERPAPASRPSTSNVPTTRPSAAAGLGQFGREPGLDAEFAARNRGNRSAERATARPVREGPAGAGPGRGRR